MLGILSDPTYARLFAAHVVALLGTGLMTVALALLAFDMAGERAGAVLGTALAIKMIAYVGLAPITAALAARCIPTVLAGLALPDSRTHSPNERLLLETFALGVAAAKETYRRIGALER